MVLRIETEQPARCPMCQCDLVGQVVAIAADVCFCSNCVQCEDLVSLQALVTWVFTMERRGHWSTAYGLMIYTPPSYHPRRSPVHHEAALLEALGLSDAD